MLFKSFLATHIALQIFWTYYQEIPCDLNPMESIFIDMIVDLLVSHVDILMNKFDS